MFFSKPIKCIVCGMGVEAKTSRRKYCVTCKKEKAKERMVILRKNPEWRAKERVRVREYVKRPEVRARLREHEKTPARKAYRKKYALRPYVKEYHRRYEQTPGAKEARSVRARQSAINFPIMNYFMRRIRLLPDKETRLTELEKSRGILTECEYSKLAKFAEGVI